MGQAGARNTGYGRDEPDEVGYLEKLISILQALDAVLPPTDAVAEYLVPAKACILSYEPREEDAAFYIIEGKATFHSGESTFLAGPGTFLFLPQPVGFGCIVPPSGPVRILSWTTPPGLAQRATGLGSPADAFVLSPPSTFASEKVQQLASLLKAYLGRGGGAQA
jgi:mannose-6-phosphate isomerase-like protein (cupin superfamily)